MGFIGSVATGLEQKGSDSLAGSSIVAPSSGGCVGSMAKRSWVGGQANTLRRESLDDCLDIGTSLNLPDH